MTEATLPDPKQAVEGVEVDADLGVDDGITADDERVPERLRARDQLMDSLAKRAAEEKEADNKEYDELFVGADGRARNPDGTFAKTGDAAPADAAPAATPALELAPADDTEELVIDGQKVRKPKTEVHEAGIRALQKQLAADRRLEEAARMLREAKEREAFLMQQMQRAAPAADPAQNQQAPQHPDDVARYKSLTERLRYASDEEAAAAVREMEQFVSERASRAQQATLQAVTQQLPQAVASQVEFNAAKEWFLQEYSDIAKDPNLSVIAIVKDQQARQEGDTRPIRERWKAIGDELRQWRGASNVASMEDKAARKATLDEPKPMAARSPAPAKEPTPEEARAQYFKERRARFIKE